MSSSELLLQKEQELAQLRERSLRDLQARVTVAALPAFLQPSLVHASASQWQAAVCMLQVAEKEQELEAANSKVAGPLSFGAQDSKNVSLQVDCGGSHTSAA